MPSEARDLAAAVGEWFLLTHIREGMGPQRMDLRHRLGVTDEALLRAVVSRWSNATLGPNKRTHTIRPPVPLIRIPHGRNPNTCLTACQTEIQNGVAVWRLCAVFLTNRDCFGSMVQQCGLGATFMNIFLKWGNVSQKFSRFAGNVPSCVGWARQAKDLAHAYFGEPLSHDHATRVPSLATQHK